MGILVLVDAIKLLEASHPTPYERRPSKYPITFQRSYRLNTRNTSRFVVPCIQGLRYSFQLLSLAYNSKMVDTVKKSIENRLSKFKEDAKFKFAITFNPRFKLKWCNDEKE